MRRQHEAPAGALDTPAWGERDVSGSPPRISPTKLRTFDTCPKRYAFRYVFRVPEEPSLTLVRGSLIHLALRELHRHRAPSRAHFAHAARSAVRHAWKVERDVLAGRGVSLDGLVGPEPASSAFAQEIADAVIRYLEAGGLEGQFRAHEFIVQSTLGAFRLEGRIDQLALDRDGRYVVVDWKSGLLPPSDSADEHWHRFSARFYAVCVEDVFLQPPSRLVIHYVEAGERLVEDFDTDVSRESRLEILDRARALEVAHDEVAFPAAPGRACAWCGYRGICPGSGARPVEDPTGMEGGIDVNPDAR